MDAALVIAIAFAIGIPTLIGFMVLQMLRDWRVVDLKSELEAADLLIDSRNGEIQCLRESMKTMEEKYYAALQRAREADYREGLANKIKDASLAKTAGLQVRATQAIVQFTKAMQDIFGKDTCKSLGDRLLEKFAAAGPDEGAATEDLWLSKGTDK